MSSHQECSTAVGNRRYGYDYFFPSVRDRAIAAHAVPAVVIGSRFPAGPLPGPLGREFMGHEPSADCVFARKARAF